MGRVGLFAVANEVFQVLVSAEHAKDMNSRERSTTGHAINAVQLKELIQ